MKISLLHATYFSSQGPNDHRNTWLAAAQDSSRVSYVVAMDEADQLAVSQTAGLQRVVTSPPDDYSSAVQNWNAAAEIAGGDLLFVISDDLYPFPGWDKALVALCADLNPLATDFALKVRDSPNPADTTLRHPVVSRRFYESFGLFDPNFRGVYCDNDITMRAFLLSRIVDGRELSFRHSHPHFERDTQASVSHNKINATREYRRGSAIFQEKYGPLHRGLNLNRLSLPAPTVRHTISRGARRLLFRLLWRTKWSAIRATAQPASSEP